MAAEATESPITVREVLALPIVTRGVPDVLAGSAGLDRPVRWVHSGEVPYMAQMLKGGELLLITGIGMGAAEAGQRRFLTELADRGIAGLAIELGARFRGVPRVLVDEAEKHGLPLIALHHEIRFVEVTEAVHREIVSRQVESMRRADELHRKLTSMMLDGAGIPEALAELAGAVGNPVILEKAGQGVLYHANHKADDSIALAAWDAFARRLPGAPETIEQPVPSGSEEGWGRLVALAVEGRLDQRARVALERAVGLIALALLRDLAEDTVTGRERGNFLVGLLEREVDDAEARQRAAAIGFSREHELLLPLAIGRSSTVSLPAGPPDDASWTLIWRDLQRELAGRQVPVIAGTRDRGRQLLMVVALQREEARGPMADRVAGFLAEAAARHLGVDDAALICVGPVARSWSALGAGLRAAVESLPGAAHGQPRTWHDVTMPDLAGLLWSLRERPELRRFTAARLDPLLEHDRRRRSRLLPTLAAYCAHGGRKAETARALHIERQSLYHRLSRIEKLLEVDLSDGETLLGLYLALRAREHLLGLERSPAARS